MKRGDQVKVLFEEDGNVETLWAECVGPDQYRLDNSPFWAYGVSWLDVVEAHPDVGGILRFARVLTKSGHRTLRIRLQPPADKSRESQAVLDQVAALGATYEGMHPGYIALDVAPDIELSAIVAFLTTSGREWEYANPTYAELFPEDVADDV